MTDEQKIEVIQAQMRGETIQWRQIGCSDWREDGNKPKEFDFVDIEYRVKPKSVAPKIFITEGYGCLLPPRVHFDPDKQYVQVGCVRVTKEQIAEIHAYLSKAD